MPDHVSDEYPTCEVTYASLRVFSDLVDTDSITSDLQTPPTSGYRPGDTGPHGGVIKRFSWLLGSEGHVDSRDLRRHVDWLLDQVDEDALTALVQDRAVDADVLCYWLSKHGHGGPTLDPSQMERLSKIGLPLAIDVYPLSDGDQAPTP